MNYETFISHVNNAFRGSDDDPPTEDTPDYNLWLNTTNRKMAEWARDGKNKWQSLFQIIEVGNISSGVNEIELDEEFLLPADSVTVLNSVGQTSKYTLVKPQERNSIYNAVYISGYDPQVLTFVDSFPDDSPLIDGVVNLAGYVMPDEIVGLGDTIPVDDPYWLVMAVASELAFNDLTYSDKASDLNEKANNLYRQMASNNRKGTYRNPRTAPTNVQSIRGVSDRQWRNDR